MSSTKSKKSKKSDQKTKDQLLRALSDAHDLLEAQEKELAYCKSELQKERSKLNQLQAPDNEEQLKEIEFLQGELEKLKVQNETRQLRIQELEKLNADLQEQLSLKNKIAMAAISQSAVVREPSFEAEQENREISETKTLVPMSETKRSVSIELSPGELLVIPKGGLKPGKLAEAGQPFQLQVSCTFSNGLEEKRNLRYKISLYAKNLDGGKRQILGEISGDNNSGESLLAKADIPSLPKGIYRLEAVGVFQNTGGEAVPMAAFQESSIINIF